MKHISIDLTKMFSGTLEKDLMENEAICPVCDGTGVVKRNNVYSIKDDTSETAKGNLFPYNHQSLGPCPNCYNGVIKLCEFCGKQISREYINRCNCEQYKENEANKKRIRYQETIDKAKKIGWDSASEYVYDEKSNRFFSDEDEFADYYWDLYQCGDHGYQNFDEYFENEIPKVLWDCEKTRIKINAESIAQDACEDLHEDAYSNIDGLNELQSYLDAWCDKQSGTTTFYPCYSSYIEVTKDLFLN